MSALTDRLLSLLPDLRLHRESGDDREALLLGPPGTGKSTSLIKILDAHIQAGLPPDQMLVNAFTRNATAELKRRLTTNYGLTDSEMQWVRTIHSSCFQLLQLRPEQTVGMGLLKEFGETSGYKFQGVLSQRNLDDPYAVGSVQSFGDWCYVAEELRRALTKSIPEIVSLLSRKNPTETTWGIGEATDFSESYRAWKRENGLYDFADMLELVLENRLRPNVRWMFLDEAQDMSPAQWRVAEMWKEGAERLLVAADDDQSVMVFGGADPRELWSRPGHQLVLSHSYRLPSTVHAEAHRIIKRVAERVPKQFEPHYEGGSVSRIFGWADGSPALAQRIADSEGSWFLLVRNRVFSSFARGILTDAAVPFHDRTSPGGIPTPASPRGKALKVLVELHQGQMVRAGLLRDLMRQVYPGQWERDGTRWGKAYGVMDLMEVGASPRLANEIAHDPLAAIRMEPYERDYLRQVSIRHGLSALVDQPRVIISTVHGSKGEEADHVAVSVAMTRKTYQEYQDSREGRDSEARVAYVAATRAKQSLTWVIDGQGYDI